MSFMYIHLGKDDRSGEIIAVVKTHGDLSQASPSVGAENTRLSRSPFAVFQVDKFVGLENIDTDELVAELQRRMTAAQLMQRIEFQFTSKELLDMVAERMP